MTDYPPEPELEDFDPLPYVEGPENDVDTPPKPKTPRKPKGGDDDAN